MYALVIQHTQNDYGGSILTLQQEGKRLVRESAATWQQLHLVICGFGLVRGRTSPLRLI